MTARIIMHTAADVPAPAGHYSHAVEANGMLFVSGILSVRADENAADLTLAQQIDRCLETLDKVLRAAGTDRSHVAKLTVYIADVAWWPQVNAHCAAYFRDHRPARAIVPVSTLHYGAAIEIEAIALVGAR